MIEELNKKERNAINSLKRLAKRWPDSLWLFSASGTLHVMKAGEFGEQIHRIDDDAMDPAHCVTTIDIQNDGGDL